MLGAILLLLVADVAPTRFPLVQQLVPQRAFTPPQHGESAQGRQPPLADAPVDVTLAWEKVQLDVHPTLVLVRAEFALKGGDKGERGLDVGFPSEVVGLAGQEVAALAVEVNGVPVVAKHEPHWWSFVIDVPAGGETKIVVRYHHGLFARVQQKDESVALVGYVLRTGALWRGPIGRAEINVVLHGLARDRLRWYGGPPDGSLTWSVENFEPAEDITLGIVVKDEVAAVDDPELVVLDRIVRFARIREATDAEWDALVDDTPLCTHAPEPMLDAAALADACGRREQRSKRLRYGVVGATTVLAAALVYLRSRGARAGTSRRED